MKTKNAPISILEVESTQQGKMMEVGSLAKTNTGASLGTGDASDRGEGGAKAEFL